MRRFERLRKQKALTTTRLNALTKTCWHALRKIIPWLLLPTALFAHNGIFFDADTGLSFYTGLPTAKTVNAQTVDTSYFPLWRLGIGYLHDFNPHYGFGFELGIGHYPTIHYKFSDHTQTLQSTSTDFLFVISRHFKRFDLNLHLGGIRNSLNYGAPISEYKTRIQLAAILSLEYKLTPHSAIDMRYLHAFGQKISTFNPIPWRSPSIDAAMVGLQYTFF